MAFNDFVFALKAFIGLDTSDYDKGIEESGSRLKSFGDGIKNGLGTAAKIGGAAIAAGSAAVVGFAKSALEAGQGFDTSMSQIAATLGMTTDDIQNNVDGAGDTFQALRDKAQEMGAATNFSASQAAEGLNILAMSGFDAQESIAMVEDVLHLAAAGSMDMASAAGYISGAMKGFADDTKDAQYYADLMAKGATLANTSVQQLGEAMSSGAAGAAAYGQSADSMTLSLLRLAEQGEVGAAAGTALSAAMKNLYTPTDQARAALAELGVAAYDEAGNAREFNTVVNELSDALAGMTAEEAANYKQTIFGIQGLDAYNKMTVTGIDKQNQWAEALANASEGIGETAKQYATMTDNLQGDLDILSSSFDGLKLAVSDTLMGSAREFVQFGSSALSALTEGFKEGGIDGAMEALGQILSDGLAMIVETIPDLVEVGAKLIGALGQALLDNSSLILQTAFDIILMLAQGLTEGDSIQTMIDGIVQLLSDMAMWLGEYAYVLAEAAVDIIVALIDALTDPGNIAQLVDMAIFLMLSIGQALIGAIPELIKAAPEIISNLVTAIVENVPKLLDAAWEMIKMLAEGIVDNLPEVLAKGQEIVLKLTEGILAVKQEIADKAEELIEQFKEGVKNKFDDLVTKGKEIVDKVKEGLMQTIEDAKNWGHDLIQNFISGLTEKWRNLQSTVSEIAGGIKSFLGFSEPKEGPLSNFHTYAPDMMELYARGIRENKFRVLDEISDLTASVQSSLSKRLTIPRQEPQPVVVGASGGSVVNNYYITNSINANQIKDVAALIEDSKRAAREQRMG